MKIILGMVIILFGINRHTSGNPGLGLIAMVLGSLLVVVD